MFHVKNKFILSAIAAAIICTAFTGCQSTKEQPAKETEESLIPSQPDNEHYVFIEHKDKDPYIIRKENDDSVIYINNTCESVSFVALKSADKAASKEMNRVLDEAYNSHEQSSKSMFSQLDFYLSSENADLSSFPWETKVDYSCTKNDGRAISIIETRDFYSAGEHEGTTVRAFNFNPLTGALINNIFFTDNASRDKMDDSVYNKLIEKYGEDKGINYSIVTSSMIEEALDSWYFTETGVKLIFNPGSIAPIESGAFELDLSKNELPENAQKYFK